MEIRFYVVDIFLHTNLLCIKHFSPVTSVYSYIPVASKLFVNITAQSQYICVTLLV